MLYWAAKEAAIAVTHRPAKAVSLRDFRAKCRIVISFKFVPPRYTNRAWTGHCFLLLHCSGFGKTIMSKTVFVAGGTGGLGRAVTLAFAEQDANVLVSYRS